MPMSFDSISACVFAHTRWTVDEIKKAAELLGVDRILADTCDGLPDRSRDLMNIMILHGAKHPRICRWVIDRQRINEPGVVESEMIEIKSRMEP